MLITSKNFFSPTSQAAYSGRVRPVEVGLKGSYKTKINRRGVTLGNHYLNSLPPQNSKLALPLDSLPMMSGTILLAKESSN